MRADDDRPGGAPDRACGETAGACGGWRGQQGWGRPVIRIVRQHAAHEFGDGGGKAVAGQQRGVAAVLQLLFEHGLVRQAFDGAFIYIEHE